MMIQSGEEIKRYKTSYECYRYIKVNFGYAGFFKGCFTNFARGVVGSMSLIIYDEFQNISGLDLSV